MSNLLRYGVPHQPSGAGGQSRIISPPVVAGSNVTVTGTVTAVAVAGRDGLAAPEIGVAGSVTALAVQGRTGAALPDIGATGTRTAVAAQARTGVAAADVTVTGTRTAAAVQAQTGTAVVVTTRFVTAVHASGRYFVDQTSEPILIHGDSPWSMLSDLSSSEMDTYLANRAALGTNVLLCSLIGSTGNGGPSDNGATYDSVQPFVSGDITNPNSSYWSRMDSYLSKAEALGITLMIYPIDGWNTKSGCVFNGKSDADCQDYGDFIATRWAARPNIVWAFGGDYDQGDPGSAHDSKFNACLTGIRAAGDVRPATIQMNFMRSNSFDTTYWSRRADWSFAYTYFATYDAVLAGYAKAWDTTNGKPATRPVIFSEGEYDTSPVGDGGSNASIRKQAGWALTSGSPGAFTGQERVWSFETGSPAWTTRINSTQSAQFAEILDVIRGLDKWHLLVPDTSSTLVTGGRGTPYVFSANTDDAWNSTSSYVTAARTPDKSLAVIYIPVADNTITISTSQMGANPTGTWVDPTNGATTSATWGSTFQRTTNNAAGDDDWLLILEADPVGVDVTGTRTTLSIEARTGTAKADIGIAGTGTAVAVVARTGVALPDIGVAGTRTALAVQGRSGLAAPEIGVAGTATALVVQARTGTVLADIGVAGDRTALAVQGRLGSAGADIQVAGTRTAAAVQGRDGSAVAGIVAVGSTTALAVEGRAGSAVADVAVAGTNTALAVEARTGVAATDVNIVGTRTGIAAQARTGTVSIDIVVVGDRTGLAISARTGDTTVSAVIVPGEHTTIALSARTGVAAADVTVVGSRTSIAVQARTGAALTYAGYTMVHEIRSRILTVQWRGTIQ